MRWQYEIYTIRTNGWLSLLSFLISYTASQNHCDEGMLPNNQKYFLPFNRYTIAFEMDTRNENSISTIYARVQGERNFPAFFIAALVFPAKCRISHQRKCYREFTIPAPSLEHRRDQLDARQPFTSSPASLDV